jgi:hypothetical protein
MNAAKLSATVLSPPPPKKATTTIKATTPAPQPAPLAPPPAPTEAEEKIATALQELFKSDLFKTNNYTRIFELLNKNSISAQQEKKTNTLLIKKVVEQQEKKIIEDINNYRIINSSIVNNLDKNDVILDPSGLEFMKKTFKGAGGASCAIYQLLSTETPNQDVIDHFSQFNSEKNLYEENISNLSIAYYSSYNDNNIKIIHAVGPNFTTSIYLLNILKENGIQKLYELMYKVYDDIYKTFIIQYNKNPDLKLRILPISSGLFINTSPKDKETIFTCLKLIYQELNEKNNIKPVIYLFNVDEYTLFKKLIEKDNYFSIVTANIWNLKVFDNYQHTNIDELLNRIFIDSPTIVCIQECNNEINEKIKAKGYSLIATNILENYKNIDEIINIYVKNNSNSILIKKITSNYCFTERIDIIIKYLQLKIGIVHLCGGNFDEEKIKSQLAKITDDNQDDKFYERVIKKMIIDTTDRDFIKLIKMKCENIKKLIDDNVDIILGDFNSDIENFLGTINESQVTYLTDLNLSDEQIKIWNTFIYELLNDKGYYNICGKKEDCLTFYKKLHTTIHKTSADAIYYKKTNLDIIKYNIIDLIGNKIDTSGKLVGEYSDHNAIYAKFLITTK